MNQLLVETYDKNLELVEDQSQKLPKGSLGVLKGVCADYQNPTRNGRHYSKSLWEKVFEDPRIKEGLETKTLFGELDHPADRLESLTKEAAIVMTDYSFDENNKKVMGEFHILDTPNGRILKSLVDYGSKPGISSRGRGEINEKDNAVIEDTYVFGGFDVVTLPSIQEARPDYKLTNESLEVKTFSSSIEKEISEADLSELEKIRKVIEHTSLPEKTSQSLLESIEQRKESFSNKPSDSSATTAENKLQDDLENAYKRIGELEEQLKATVIEVDILKENSASAVTESKEEIDTTNDKDNDDDDVENETDFGEDWTANAIGNEELLSELMDLRAELAESKEYQVNLESLQSVLNQKDRELALVKEERKSLLEKMNTGEKTRSAIEEQLSALEEKFNILTVEHETLQEDFKVLDLTADEASILKNELSESKSLNESLEKTLSEVNKGTGKLKKKQELIEQSFLEFADAYIELRAKQSGLSDKAVIDLLPETFTVDDVENAISGLYEEKSRKSNLPFSNDTLLSLKETRSTASEQFDTAKEMLKPFKTKKKVEGGNNK